MGDYTLVVARKVTSGAGSDRYPGFQIDVIADKADGTITHQHVDTTQMIA